MANLLEQIEKLEKLIEEQHQQLLNLDLPLDLKFKYVLIPNREIKTLLFSTKIKIFDYVNNDYL